MSITGTHPVEDVKGTTVWHIACEEVAQDFLEIGPLGLAPSAHVQEKFINNFILWGVHEIFNDPGGGVWPGLNYNLLRVKGAHSSR